MNYKADDQRYSKQKIFMIAAQSFAQKGFRGVSMQAIAEKAGVTKPVIYYYFNNKEQTFKEIIKTAIEYSEDAFAYIKSKEGWSLQQKLVELFRTWLDGRAENIVFYRLFLRFCWFSEDIPFVQNITAMLRIKLQQMLRELLKEGLDSGELTKDIDLQNSAKAIAAVFLYSWSEKMESGNKSTTPEELLKPILRGMTKGE